MRGEISRREFLALFAASVVSLGMEQKQVLEYLTDKTPLPKPIIYLDVDSMAFFNVRFPKTKPLRVSELSHTEPFDLHWPIKKKVSMYQPPESVYYYTTSKKKGAEIITVVGQCVVFGAYTTRPDGSIVSSGVYHAKTLPPDKKFKRNLDFFIDTIRPDHKREFFISGSGNYGVDNQEGLVRNLAHLFKKKGVIIKDYALDLSEMTGKINTFYSSTGELISSTYLARKD